MTAVKKPVNLSISEDVVAQARRHGLNLSEIAETALRREIDQIERETIQQRMDRTMELWNEFNRDDVTVADEFGTLDGAV
ncbi:MAG TPA: type II toxin-antitoxin system CcdA family antitoxin [Stellaceae bacterium]|jgi:antitoxin CcdA